MKVAFFLLFVSLCITLFDYLSFLRILPVSRVVFITYSINCLILNCKYRLPNSRPEKSTWPPAHGYISISAVTPTSYASCSLLPFFFFHAEKAEDGERDQTTHTDTGLHPQPPVPPAICARPSACNSTTTRPWTSAEESIHHWRERERDRERK